MHSVAWHNYAPFCQLKSGNHSPGRLYPECQLAYPVYLGPDFSRTFLRFRLISSSAAVSATTGYPCGSYWHWVGYPQLRVTRVWPMPRSPVLLVLDENPQGLDRRTSWSAGGRSNMRARRKPLFPRPLAVRGLINYRWVTGERTRNEPATRECLSTTDFRRSGQASAGGNPSVPR